MLALTRWKIGVAVASLLVVIAAGLLLFAQIEHRRLVAINTKLEASINDPATGYVARLAQAATNTQQLTVALETQNKKLRDQAAESGRQLAVLTTQIDRVNRENRKLEAAAARIMATKPKGDTLDARVRDIDQRIVETL